MWKRSLVSLLVPMLFLLTAPSAEGQTGAATQTGFPSGSICGCGGEIAAATAGVAGGLAVIAIVVVHEHNVHTLKGCVLSDAGGLQIMNGDKRSYALTGDTAGIKAGERMKLSGKKMKGDKDHKQFAVSKLTKDYGACTVQLAAR